MEGANRPPKRSSYYGLALAIAVVMFAGFARNYYLRAWLGTRVITVMVHVHGLIMTMWVVLFIVQTLLVARHRVDLHRKLGVFGAVLAAVVFGLGVYTIAGSIERQQPQAGPWLFTELFVAFDGVSLVAFFCLVVTALLYRRQREIHKRLMLIAMISLLPPALGRLVANFTHQNVELIVLGLMYSSISACLLFDGLRHRRLNPAFATAGVLVIAANQLTYFAQMHTP
jgi:hypothetical protein